MYRMKKFIYLLLISQVICFNSMGYKNNPKNFIKNKKKFNNIYADKNPKKLVKISMLSNINKEFVPDMERRSIMNIILLGSVGIPVGWMLGGFLYFLTPPTNNLSMDGLIAKDANGNDIFEKEWISNNPFPNRNLVQGLKGDAHYLIVNKENLVLQNH